MSNFVVLHRELIDGGRRLHQPRQEHDGGRAGDDREQVPRTHGAAERE
jgi:hypothetical protein